MKMMCVAMIVAMTAVVASAGEVDRYVALRADVTALPAEVAFVASTRQGQEVGVAVQHDTKVML